jgi:hypothetical protein
MRVIIARNLIVMLKLKVRAGSGIGEVDAKYTATSTFLVDRCQMKLNK